MRRMTAATRRRRIPRSIPLLNDAAGGAEAAEVEIDDASMRLRHGLNIEIGSSSFSLFF